MKTKPVLNFDDTNLPLNELNVARICEIEKAAMPLLDDLLEKLRKEKTHLSKSFGNK